MYIASQCSILFFNHLHVPSFFVGELTNFTDTDDETHETGTGFGKPDHLSRQASLAGSSPQFQQSPLQQSLNMDMLVIKTLIATILSANVKILLFTLTVHALIHTCTCS